MDSSSFCQALGPKEANKQLRRHWKTWVTEDILINLSALGGVIIFEFFDNFSPRCANT
jgi:glucan 1,3-beta-glucosidase